MPITSLLYSTASYGTGSYPEPPQGVAAQDALECHPAAAKGSVFDDGFLGVLRAGWRVAAGGGSEFLRVVWKKSLIVKFLSINNQANLKYLFFVVDFCHGENNGVETKGFKEVSQTVYAGPFGFLQNARLDSVLFQVGTGTFFDGFC